MARTVYKYPFPISDRAKVTLPFGASILHVGELHFGELTLWALVDTDADLTVEHEFYVFGTGHEVPADLPLSHRATVVSANGLVWHVFEEVPF